MQVKRYLVLEVALMIPYVLLKVDLMLIGCSVDLVEGYMVVYSSVEDSLGRVNKL